jgi:hypothetical protein
MNRYFFVCLSLLGLLNSAFANPTLSSADSNSGKFVISSTAFQGSYLDIPFSITSKNKVNAIDFLTKFNESKLTFVGIVGQDPNLESFYYLNPNDRTLRFNANNYSGLSTGKTLFSLRFKYNTSNITNADLIDTKVLLNGIVATAVIIDSQSLVMTDGSGHKVQINSGSNSITVTSAFASKLEIIDTSNNIIRLKDSLISGQAKKIQLFNFGLGSFSIKVSDGKLSTDTLMSIKQLGYSTDLNNDGVTNTQDYLILSQNFGQKCTSGSKCPSDINGDGVTDVQDYLIFMSQFKSNTCPTDLNKDGLTDVKDYLVFSASFGQKCLAGKNCASDFNSDGITNVQDYLVLAAQFGKKCQ